MTAIGRGTATRTIRIRPQWAAGVATVGAVAAPWFLDAYTISIASYAIVLALLAMSTQLLAGMAGLPSLGQAAYLGVGAYTAAIVGRHVSTSGPVQLVAAAGMAVVLATVVGPLVTRTRGIAFLLAAWAVAELVHTIAEHTTALTGGGNGLTAPAVVPLPGFPPLSGDGPTYLYVFSSFVAGAIGIAILMRTRFALVVRGIADNEERQRANGHHVEALLCTTYLVAAGIAGAAGALLVAARRYVGPADLGFDISALALLTAIIGGRSALLAAAAAVGIVAVRDIAGNHLPGSSPLLLGVLFVVVALTRSDVVVGFLRAKPGRRR